MKVVNKIADVLDKILRTICCIGILTVFVVLVIQVVVRKLGGTLSWADELTRYLTMVMIFFGAALGSRRGNAVRVSVFLNRMSPKVRKWVEVVEYTLVLGMALFLTYSMYVGNVAMGTQTLGVMTFIQLVWIYWVVFAGMVLMDIYLVLYLVNVIVYGVAEQKVEELSEEEAAGILSDISESAKGGDDK